MALPQMGVVVHAGETLCMSMSKGWGLWAGGCAQLSSANTGEDGFESSAGQDRSGLSLGLGLLTQPLPDFSQGP